MAKPGDKSIDTYREKRDFARTPEPPPEDTHRPASAAFVVHRHEARRLHYDLRLEMGGVLKSWAVPRGFSYDPTVKKLAVRTEDHPLAYTEFDGVIPKGEYGGGTMTIWDRGRYELLKADDGPQAVEAGKLEIRLRGAKLRGEWHMVKTRSEKQEWILFKARDRYARDDSEKAPFFDLAAARQTPLPDAFDVMSVGETVEAFSDPDWLFEVEFAGKRAGLRIEGDGVQLVGLDGDRLPEILEDAKSLRCENGYLDGVLVATDENQRPSRVVLERRLQGNTGDTGTVVFYAFDLLYYEEWDLTTLPLLDRKQMLTTVLPKLQHVLFVDHGALERRRVLRRDRRGRPTRSPREANLEPVHSRSLERLAPRSCRRWRKATKVPKPSPRKTSSTRSANNRASGRSSSPISTKSSGPRMNTPKAISSATTSKWPTRSFPISMNARATCSATRTVYHGKAFYQKDAPSHIPDWVETESIASHSKGEAIPLHCL